MNGIPVVLAKPQPFMNSSGLPIGRLQIILGYIARISWSSMTISTLLFGRIKIKMKGGDGGHKGVRSLIDAFGGDEFARVRMGVGRGLNAAAKETMWLIMFWVGLISEEARLVTGACPGPGCGGDDSPGGHWNWNEQIQQEVNN